MKKENIIIGSLILLCVILYSFSFKKNNQNRENKYEKRQLQLQEYARLQTIKDSIFQDSIQRHENLVKCMKDSIQIIRVNTSEPNSAGGVDVDIVWKNKTKNTIKYITFKVRPYNSVGDIVGCEVRGFRTDGLNVTGPIKSGTTYGYNKYWSNVWYNHTIKKGELIGYDITYMNGEEICVDLI
jgi:hypothetical protein